jgi:hypothetical protein
MILKVVGRVWAEVTFEMESGGAGQVEREAEEGMESRGVGEWESGGGGEVAAVAVWQGGGGG